MKVIDLLNKIANGEEVPKKIKFKGIDRIYEYNRMYNWFDDNSNDNCKDTFYICELNEEVEIIEEDKKIKKLGHWVDVKTWVKGNDLETGLREQSEFNKNVFYKINEIIDKLNKEE